MKSTLFFVMLLFLLSPGIVNAQKKQKSQAQTEAAADTVSASPTSSSQSEELSFSEENLAWLGFGPQNYRNLHLRLSQPLVGKQMQGDVHVDDEGKIVYKKRPDIRIDSDDRGLVTNWVPLGKPGWIDDHIEVSFTLKGEKAPYAVIRFQVREWAGDETTSILPDSKEADGSLFYISTAEGKYSFPPSAAETRLLFDLVTEDSDEPTESETRKPGESTGGKKETNKWSNRGMTVADL